MFVRAARAVTLSLAALAVAAPALAQWKPTKPVDLIVHTGPGGGSDLLARAMVTMIEKEKLVPVRINVLNKPGGGGAVAAAAVAERKGDPHTLGLITSVWIAGPLTSKEARVTVHDLKPIAQLMLEPAVFAVKADSPYKTLKDFIEAAKARPGALKQSGGSPPRATTSCACRWSTPRAPSGRSSRSPAAGSASPRCWAATWTSW
jgi:putative tricarboxylic transport membrane protein